MSLTDAPEWRRLQFHAALMGGTSLQSLFEREPERSQIFSRDILGLYFDFSKQRITEETLSLLVEYAKSRDLSTEIQRLFVGQRVNHTENRAALHMQLRAPTDQAFVWEGQDLTPEIFAVKTRMKSFARAVRLGQWVGCTGKIISDVVNIGIGGSDLGPKMVCHALPHTGPRSHFVSNVDGTQLHDLLQGLDPEQTLFIVTSKTFTTQETLSNARRARQWLIDQHGEESVAKHFVAVSTNQAAVERFGIDPENMFGFWDWVGGRYSLWGAVGLSILLSVGEEVFDRFLLGAHDMDRHFKNAPLTSNLPVLMGLITFWNSNFLGYRSQVLAPYAQRLAYFPAWAQQLEMESNGKYRHNDGKRLDFPSTPVLWGDVGTNSQHAFFQMLHQGTEIHPVDFIAVVQEEHPYPEMHQMLLANCLAQAAALMSGKDEATVIDELTSQGYFGPRLTEAVPHRIFEGSRPSNMLLLPKLDAYYLGALLALYEHRTYVLGVLWNINPFDQWGVELGKQLCHRLLPALTGLERPTDFDSSTLKLLYKIRQMDKRHHDY